MAKHDDAAEDKKLIASELKKRGLKQGGMAKYAKGGGVSNEMLSKLGRNMARTKFETGKMPMRKSGRGR